MIGVFDSGLGGLSVLSAIVGQATQADLLYCADTAYLPYGNKSPETIRQRVVDIGHYLLDQGCTTLVVACNTATVSAVHDLRRTVPTQVAVIGVEPGIKPAALSTQSGQIAVLVTPATARSDRLAQLIAEHAQGVRVHIVPCPDWASRVETLRLDEEGFAAQLRNDAHRLLLPLIAQGVDCMVLGCTHYSFLRKPLAAVCGEDVQWIDVAQAVARQTLRRHPQQAGQARLYLRASAHPERLRHALPKLGLAHLLPRVVDCAQVQQQP
jgi:glutamate racemase